MSELPSKTFCVIPWTHLAFEPNGKVVPCCLTSAQNNFSGDLNVDSIEKVWNGDLQKKLRRQMMNGEEPEICCKCFDRERVTGESSRTYQNKDFASVIPKVKDITLEDGTCTEMELLYWDFRFSNLCNFKCRTCGPRYSSAWIPDIKKMGWKVEDEKVINFDGVDGKNNYEFIKDQIKYVRKIYFAGGEPLLMPEHWSILDMLVENKRFDVKINYNTNCSTLTYGKKNVLDYWQQWDYPKIEVWPSIDEIDERAEIVRSGTVWERVEKNIIDISKFENIILRPGITVGALNVFRMPEIIERLIEIGGIDPYHKYKGFFLNLVEHPHHYHVMILPDDFKREIIIKLNNFVENYNMKYNKNISHLFTHILHELTKPFDIKSAKKFVDVTNQIDKVRSEKLIDVIPELERVYDAVRRINENV
jgi:radical SAM protein with 4Fe4S-binding SPASM domain